MTIAKRDMVLEVDVGRMPMLTDDRLIAVRIVEINLERRGGTRRENVIPSSQQVSARGLEGDIELSTYNRL